MKLDLCGERTVEPRDAETLAGLIEEYCDHPDFFAVLSTDDQVYMQVAGNTDEGFVLEYRDGSPMTHFRCADAALDLQPVMDAMTMYFAGDGRWRTAYVWHPFACP